LGATEARRALVKGGGEVGSAVALRLWRAGWQVVVVELERPTVLRRQLSVAEAAYVGQLWRGEVRVERAADAAALERLLRPVAGRSSAGDPRAEPALPLFVGMLAVARAVLDPAVVVDARMRRGAPPERQRGEAPLVIGLGPGLRAGEDVDVVVETCPGPALGQALWSGAALPHRPLPRGGDRDAAEQYAYAPAAGRWRTARAIGEVVAAGALLGTVDAVAVPAPCAGRVRGLVHDGLVVPACLKVAAVHPGDWRHKEAGIEHRTAAIAATVLGLAEQHAASPAAVAS
jgi:xanthine dehydrogenase accessory factor